MARGSVTDRRKRGRGWEARWYIVDKDGKRRQKSASFDTKKQAERYLIEVLGDAAKRKYGDPADAPVPFSVVAEQWIERGSKGWKPKTEHGYRTILNHHLRPEFGNRHVNAITLVDMRRFLEEMDATSGTRRNVLRVLSQVLDHAVEEQLIESNPAKASPRAFRSVLKTPSSSRREMLFLDEVQVGQLAHEVGPDYSTLIYTAAYTGLRAGELAALRRRHFKPSRKGRELSVLESVADINGRLQIDTPKNRRPREVSLPAFLIPMLEEQSHGKGPDDFIFGNEKPLRHANFYGRHFRPAVRRLVETDRWPAELQGLRFHDLRHTAAAILISNGEHPKAIADRLGHSDIGITMNRYGHLYTEDKRQVADRLDESFRKAQEASPRLAPVTPIRPA